MELDGRQDARSTGVATALRVDLLGPMRVESRAGVIDLGGPNPRLVLALLALDTGRVVSIGRLVTAVWGDDAPSQPRAGLQVIVSNLRGALREGDEDPTRIEHEGGGYVLRLPREDVDVHCFEAEVAHGASLVDTEPRRAATVLRDALGLWRGRPFGDLADEPALVADARRLEEVRLRALERRIAADLRLGDHELVVDELRTLVETHPLREPLWAQLSLAQYRSGHQAEALRTHAQLRSHLTEELGTDPTPALQDLHARMLRQDPGLDHVAPDRDRAAGGPAQRPTRNPYKGLQAFDEDDASDFFGRDELIDGLVDRLGESRLLAVVGPSGSGKSSVVGAGLVPVLAPGDQRSGAWQVVTMAPGEWPMAELERSLEDAGRAVDDLARDLATPGRGLSVAADRALDAGLLLLVVDQFEELFSLAREVDRDAFIRVLAEAASADQDRVRVVLTLRADFYDRALLDPDLGPLIADHTVAVSPLAGDAVERVVRGPAERVGLEVEPELVAALVAETVDAPGSLPLLQYTLTELYDMREQGTLRLDDLHRLGGVRGALTSRADELYDGLGEEGRQVCRQVFLRLVTVTSEAIESRRRVLRSQLHALGPEDLVEEVLESFGDHRLLTFDRDPFSGAATVELAHESLTRAWGRFRGWIDAARDDLMMRRRLLAASEEWRLGGHDESYLLRGMRLQELLAWMKESSIRLADDERAYVEASVAARDERRAEQQQREEREARLQRRSTRRLRALVAVLLAGGMVATGLAVAAFQQRDRALEQEAAAQAQQARAEQQERIARSRELAAAAMGQLDEDPERSMLLAIEAVEATRGADGTVVEEAETALHRAVAASRTVAVRDTGGGFDVAADGTIATIGMDGLLEVRGPDGDLRWDTDDRARSPLMADPDGSVPASFVGRTSDVSFDPAGERLASTADDFTVEIHDAATGDLLATLEGPAARPVFAPTGDLVAAVVVDEVNQDPWGNAREIGLWDATSGELVRVLEGHTTGVLDHAFSPDGTRLASAAPTAGELRVWDVATGAVEVDRPRALAKAVAFAPDGASLAVGSGDGLATVARLPSMEEAVSLKGHDGDVFAVAFSPQGDRVVVAGGGAEVFSVATGDELMPLAGHAAVIADAAFTSDGEHVVTSSEDGTTRVWDVQAPGGHPAVNLPGPPPPARGVVAASPSSEQLAASSADGVRIHATDTWGVLRTLPSDGRAVSEVVYAPDGSRIAVGLFRPGAGAPQPDPRLVVWDLETGDVVLEDEDHGGMIFDLAFSADGTRLATGTDDEGVARVIDIDSGTTTAEYHLQEGSVLAVEFTPSGLFVGGQDAGYLIDPDTGDELVAFAEADETIIDERLLDDGLLVTGDVAGRVQVWDPATGRRLRTLRRAQGGAVVAVATHQDLVASAGPGGVVLTDATGGHRVELGAVHVGPVHDLDFTSDGRHLVSTGSDGTVRVSLVELDEVLGLARDRLTRELTQPECERFLRVERCPLP